MSAARKEAHRLLIGVMEHQRLLSEIPPGRGLTPADLARANRLANQTLRFTDKTDRLLGRYLRRLPPTPIMAILRMGVVELCEEGEAAHGVVNDLVSLARGSRKHARMSGLVNATLRKVATEGPAIWQALPAPQMPKWLRKPLVADYGKATVAAMEVVHAAGAPLDLTLKSGDPAALAKQVDGTVLPNNSVRIQGVGQVSALFGFNTGDWWVQDAAAAMPVALLDPQPGETILDLCAAPGGKTMQLAAAGAKVTALDQSARRMARVEENLKRTGLTAELIIADALEHRGQYDAILLDAPCSATGTIRRHPDLPYAKDGTDFPELFKLQERLIDHALALLKPGGRMVFCTCSLLPDEGEIQITDALERHANLSVEPAALPWQDDAWKSSEGGLRLRPDFWAERGGMDGFYMARLRKK